jgi:hypothetical protein
MKSAGIKTRTFLFETIIFLVNNTTKNQLLDSLAGRG